MSAAKPWLRAISIYFLQAAAFAVGSYLLIILVYGGIRISFFAWSAIVLLAFAVAYIPYFIRGIRKGKEVEAKKASTDDKGD